MRYKVSVKNMTREQVMVYVDFILEGHSIAQAIDHFHSSRKYINSVLDKVRLPDGVYYNELLATKMKCTLERLLLEARAKAGSKSRREFIISDEEAIVIVIKIASTGITLRELAKIYNCSITTIANAVKRVANSDDLSAIVKARTEKMGIISEAEHYETQRGLLNDSEITSYIDYDALDEIRNIYSSRGRK